MKIFRFAAIGVVWSVALALLTVAGCSRNQGTGPKDVKIEGAKERQANLDVPKVRFTEVTDKAGVDFTHVNGAFGRKMLPETMGAGVAFFDYDKDGKPDLLLINSCYWPGFEEKGARPPTMAFYRNLGKGQFENVTEKSGLAITMYGQGVTVGDYDNDGWPDLFITGVGGNRLLRNVGDAKTGRRFVDVTKDAGDLTDADSWPAARGDAFLAHADALAWPSSAAFVDFDNDGKLDLFVCNYLTWSPKIDLDQRFTLTGAGQERAYGPPRAFQGTHCTLYRNLGGGKFKNVTAPAGIQVAGELGQPIGKALGVAVCDVDNDGWQDIIVANDTVRNFFFHNQQNGTFKERGQEAGIAYAEGSARGAMGIDWGEYRPGRFAVVIGNFANEPNTLLRLDHPQKLLFSDVATLEGLWGPSRIVLKFGLFFFDFDLDGLLDLLTCNGHLEPLIHLVQSGQSFKQPAQLYWNTGSKFEPVTSDRSGKDLFQHIVGRGCAYADIDGDGDLDVVLTENGGAARLLVNEGGTGNHWIRLALEGDGVRSNTSAIGARVIVSAGGKTYHRQVTSARGYLSQCEFPITVGLGKTAKVDRVEILWPGRDAGRTVLTDLAADREHHIVQPKK
ncbi:MAG: CRTAC1 family protein [Gemmataceae bacterium]|nr:CRTAC1 family protein [Gemmataceae bacterium]